MHRERLLCVVDAGTNSTPLPGSALMDVGGRTTLRFMLDRLATLRVDDLVVATSTLAHDDSVALIAAAAGVPVIRGDDVDGLARLAAAIEAFPADHVIRLTADSPLSDPNVVEMVIARQLDSEADYTSNVFPRTFPRGLDVEMVKTATISIAFDEAADPIERKRVTPFVYRRPRRFRLANVRNRESLGAERWTVEYEADLKFLREAVARTGDGIATWRSALAAIGRRAVATRGAVVLTPAGREHVSFFLACRNDDDAIRHSRGGHPIDRREHAEWFATAVDDPGVRLRLASIDGEAIGTTRIDVHDGAGQAVVALAPQFRRRDLDSAVVGALISDVTSDHQVAELVAHVHEDDAAALDAFGRSGFVGAGDDPPFRELHFTVPSM